MIFEKRKCRQLDFPEKLPCGRLEKPKCTIRGHKGQSSIRGIRVRIPRKLDAVAFKPWNLDVVAFCLLKICLGNKMCELIVSVFRCRGFLALESRFRGICASTASLSFSLNLLYHKLTWTCELLIDANYFVSHKLVI